jgi:YidC/Oxa1 family membrane protein insertase
METKRLFLAIFLSFAVLAIYQAYFAPPPPKPVTGTADTSTASAPVSPANGSGVAPASAQAMPGASGAAPLPSTSAPIVGDASARDIEVDTDSVHAVFSTAGATLKSWRLKKYLEDGQPLELVPVDIPDSFPRAFTLATNDAALSKTLASALFRPSADRLVLGSQPGTLSFEYSDRSGLTARKTFNFQPEGKAYVLNVVAAVDVAGTSRPVTLEFGPAVGLGYQPDGSRSVAARAVQLRSGKVEHLSASSIGKQGHYEGDLKFAGAEDQYFLSAALPGTEKIAIDYQALSLPVPNDAKKRTRSFISYSVSVPGSLSLPFFLGPKDFDILRDIDPRLELARAIDFGIFAWLVAPLLLALKWINGYIGNFGWSIIILTGLLNLVMFPLRHRSMVSMKKMQGIQPEMKAIQDRYAKYKVTDPERQKMNTEMMALYKQKGVSPVSGCLPMLLTLPVLWAFYALLSSAIELRGAPFIWWITDLSRHDPLYITPVAMGLTMLVQMRMTPTTADPMQKNMMLIMPLVFTATSFFWPSGLVLYWFSSNLFAMGQQYLTNQMIAAPSPASKRVTSGARKS